MAFTHYILLYNNKNLNASPTLLLHALTEWSVYSEA